MAEPASAAPSNPSGLSVSSILADPARAAATRLDSAFTSQHQRNVAWLIDRLSKSTAGVRGLIADTPRLVQLTLADADATPQLSPTIVALIAQAYAGYFLESARERETPAAFVGFDARFLSREFGEIFTRVFAGNGVRVVRDHRDEPTPTPVTSFMAVYKGLNGGIQITASHNPPNHNGVKSSTSYGGVDTDDISDRIAAHVHALIDEGGEIRFAALPSPLVEEIDAKATYAREYLAATFPAQALEPLRQAVEAGAGFLFDGLHGVGGMAMRQYLDLLLPGVGWASSIRLLNDVPNSRIGGIEKPDPSDPGTLVLSGAIAYLVEHPNVLVSVTADMDADRIGTAVLIPETEVARARKFGLFVSVFEGGVHAVRFTPNQIFTLIAYDRLLTAAGCSPAELRQAVRAGRIDGSRYHLLTTIASSVLAEQMARTYGLSFHLTAVGFKNLGKLAWQIDRSGKGDVILALMEESGGAQIGPFRPWNDQGDTIHRDKDTCALALALFNLAARLRLQGRTVLDFYLEMAEQFGSLAYFERLDAYLPNREVAEDPQRGEEANQVKAEMLGRLVALNEPANHPELLRLLGCDPAGAAAEPAAQIEEISLLVKERGEWKTIHPTASRYRLPDGGRIEFYRAGPYPHDGMRINAYDPAGTIRHWCLVRASGTEALLRVYMEIVEPLEGPRPERLADQFEPLLRYLGLDRYAAEPGQPDYVTRFRQTVTGKYG
jgi:phosphomannomutase